MYLKHALFALTAAAGLGHVGAQNAQASPAASGAAAVPSDLSGGFKPEQLTMQVSFASNQADQANGVPPGAQLSQQQTAHEPAFALGDSSGVNTEIKFVFFLVDTTDASHRVLHYVRADFQADEVKTELQSATPPQMAWKGPGTLGEPTGPRQYTFLMYEQPGAFAAKGLPPAGQPVNVQDFVKQNGLQKAIAGQTMQVNVQQSPGADAGGNSTAAAPPQSSGNSSTSQDIGQTPQVAASAAPPASPSSSAAGPPSDLPPGSGGELGVQQLGSGNGTGTSMAVPSGTAGLAAISSIMQSAAPTGSPTGAPSASPSTGAPASSQASFVVPANAWAVTVVCATLAFAAGLVL